MGGCFNLRFFMEYIDECGYLGNLELLDGQAVAFVAESATPESEWVKVEQWLNDEIFGKNRSVMSTFQSPFERRVLRLLFEHNHPTILYTSEQLYDSLPTEYRVSSATPQMLALFQGREYPSLTSFDRYDLAMMNLADEVVTIGINPESPTQKLVEVFRSQSNTPYRAL